jgi:hypothetical protein
VVAVHFDHASASANTVNSTTTCGSNQTVLQVDLKTDWWPGDTSWNVVDITNPSWEVLSKNDYSDERTFHSDLYCLNWSNCYQFTINDSVGDGIVGDGKYTVFYDDGIIAEGGEFGSSETSIRFGDGCPTQSPSVSVLPTTTPSPSSSPTSTVSPTVRPSAFPSTSPTSTVSPTGNPSDWCGSNHTGVIQVDLQTDAYPGKICWNVVEITNSSWGESVSICSIVFDGSTLLHKSSTSMTSCHNRSNCYQFSIENDSWGDANYTVLYDDGIIVEGRVEFGSSETSIRFGDGCPTQSPSVSALPTTTPSPSSSPSTVSPSVSPSAFPSTSPSSSPSWTPSVFLVVGVGVAGIVGALLFHKLIYARRRAAR